MKIVSHASIIAVLTFKVTYAKNFYYKNEIFGQK